MGTFLKVCGIVTVLLVAGIMVILWGTADPYVPTEGVWYCEELQIQISFEANQPTFKSVGEYKIICEWEHDKNSRYISVICLEEKNTVYTVGDVVFGGEYVALDDMQFVLSDEKGTIYTFFRIE